MADDKKKRELATQLGTGGARRAADAYINRHKQIDDLVNGSMGRPSRPSRETRRRSN